MRVIVADDHPLYRDGLVHFIQEQVTDIEIAEAADFKAVLDHLARPDEPAVDMVFLDLEMPGTDWRQALNDLVAKSVPVVVVSAVTDPNIIKEVVTMGAAGFVPKNCSGKVMRGALQLILSGGIYLPLAILEAGSPPRMFPHKQNIGKISDTPHNPLTNRQMDVLSLLWVGQSNKEIAHNLDIAEGTVKLHVTAILKSLGANNRTQAVMTAWQNGLLGEAPFLP